MADSIAAGGITEFNKFKLWEIEDIGVLWKKSRGFAKQSPCFFIAETGACQWQFELIGYNENEKLLKENSEVAVGKVKNYMKLKLRLIEADVMETFQHPFSVTIACSMENSVGEYYCSFYNRETFSCTANTSWHSQEIDGISLMEKLKGGALNIRLKLELINYSICDAPAHKLSVELHDNLKKMMKERRYTDLVIVDLNGNEIFVHRCVLASRSPKFDDMMKAEPLPNIGPKRICIEMSHCEMEEFVKFVYNGTLTSTLSVPVAIRLFQMAIKYEMPDLKRACEDNLVRNMTSTNYLDILIFAHEHQELSLKERALQVIATLGENFLAEDSFLSIDNDELLNDITIYIAEHRV